MFRKVCYKCTQVTEYIRIMRKYCNSSNKTVAIFRSKIKCHVNLFLYCYLNLFVVAQVIDII